MNNLQTNTRNMKPALRPWRESDLDNLVELADNFNVAKFMTDAFPHPYTREHGRKFISVATANDPIHIFAIEFEGNAVGGIGIHPQQDIMKKNAELGYWLGEPYWRKGIMIHAIREILAFAFETYDISRIYARPFSNNIASQKLLQKAGFTLEAQIAGSIFKNGEYLDELIYAVRR